MERAALSAEALQVEIAMRLIQQGHDVGLVLFQEQKPARVASYECAGDLRRAQAWSRQCEACELLGRQLAAAANGLGAGEQQYR